MRWKPDFCDIILSPPLVVHPNRQTSPLHGGTLPVAREQASLYWKTMTHTVEKERMGKRRMRKKERDIEPHPLPFTLYDKEEVPRLMGVVT